MLPRDQVVCHAVAQVRFDAAAAWRKFDLVGADGAALLVRVDGGSRASSALDALVGVKVENLAAAGGASVYFTARDPDGGAVTLGVQVEAGAFAFLPLYGTSTPAEGWVYGDATTPSVQVTAYLAEGV